MTEAEKIDLALARMNEENAQDPTLLETPEGLRPRELVMAERLERWVRKIRPEPSVALVLASRCQHLKRFSVPRSDYPEGRVGYLKWRKDLSKLHADLAEAILREVGLDDAIIAQVREINQKQGLKVNPDTQVMEDALCLSFLEHEFAEFVLKHDAAKVIDIVQKTWKKMSPEGHRLAVDLPFSGRAGELVHKALS